MRKGWKWLLGGGAAGGALFGGYQFGWITPNGQFPAGFSKRGIDVSAHQGAIDWKEVVRDRVDFVYIKATEGGDFVDKRFQQNWTKAEQVGLRRGAYHFFTFARDGATQAANFIATVPKDAKALPPVVDLEFGGNSRQRSPRERLLRELVVFIGKVEAHFGQPVRLYTTYDFYEQYLRGTTFKDYWIRDILGRPGGEWATKWTIWQFSERGRVAGIQGPVDLNVMR